MAKKKKKALERRPPLRAIAFKIDEELRAELEAEAAAQERNMSQMITHYIKVGLGLAPRRNRYLA